MRGYSARIAFTFFITVLVAKSGVAASAFGLVPSRGPVGGYVIVTGSGLDVPDIVVTFAGPGGSRVPASTASQSAALIECRVPLSATTGDVRLTRGSVLLGAFPFTVTPAPRLSKAMTLAIASSNHDLFKNPASLFVSGRSGTTYIADTAHHQVRVVSPSGEVRVLAGSGTVGFINGPTASAQFRAPEGVVVDEARSVVYVADTGNHVIRAVTSGGVVQTFAGSGRADDRDGSAAEAGFDAPAGLALDAFGNLYVADRGNDKIRKVTPSGIVTTVGTGFKRPRGVAISDDGAVYIADTGNHVIKKISDGIISIVAGTGHPGLFDGVAALAEFKEPASLAVEETGALIVADTQNHAIRRVAIDGNGEAAVSTIAGTGQPGFRDGDPLMAQFKQPGGIAVRGAVYVADSQNDAVRMLLPELTASAAYPRSGTPLGGTLVRVFGNGFIPGQTVVEFGSTAVSQATYISSTELQVIAPPGAPGTVDVQVTTPAGTSTLADAFRYVEPPTINSVVPSKGTIAGGQTVTISGANFIAGETSVFFGTERGTSVTVTASATLTCLTPAHTAGSVDVSVTTPGGTALRAAGFKYLDPPTITSFTPPLGRVGATIAIIGQNFDSDLFGNTVALAGMNVPVLSGSTTQLVINVPVAATSGRFTVTTTGGSAVSAADFVVLRYTSVVVAPASSSLNIGESVQLTASGVFATGTMEPLTSDVSWTSSNPSVATVDNSGMVRSLAEGSTTITATYAGLSGQGTITIQSAIPLPPDPSTIASAVDPTRVTSLADEIRFLYVGPNAIQTGVAANAIEERRATVFRGRVLHANGLPHPGCVVSVLNHPEYGQTLSRADGWYDIVVNGGGSLTLRYQCEGYVDAQRLVVSQWAQQKAVDDVVLIAYDSAATLIAMQSSLVQVARGSVSADADGTRRATLVVPSGMSATLVMPDGTTRPASALTLRATEFTVGPKGPLAMPAALPPTSGYTYCVEISADEAIAAGAAEVQFSKPVAFYVENFIGFPVGGNVPVGYYDRANGSWKSSNNGRVIKVLSIAGGSAQLDTNGDNAADNALGIAAAELQKLATLYAPGQTLWRVPISHLTPYDCNWPYWTPDDATAPAMPAPAIRRGVEGGCKIPSNSTVDCHNQTLAEEIPIVGTPFSLLYDSGRISHGQYYVTVNLTGSSIPPSLRDIELNVEIAGRNLHWTFPPQPNLKYRFLWDGRDAYGRLVTGMRDATIRLDYVYPQVYQNASQSERAFMAASGLTLKNGRVGIDVTLSQTWTVPLGHFDIRPSGLAGWSLSAERFYDARARVLYDGDTNRAADPQGTNRATVRTIAGTGQCCNTGDGGPAVDAKLLFPDFVAVASDGTLYLAQEDQTIRRVGPDGIITTIAGNGQFGFTPDGSAAMRNRISLWDIAVGPDDTLYFNDIANYRIRRIVGGVLTTVAGNGQNGFNSVENVEGRSAASIAISPEGIAVGADGTLYIADRRRVLAVGRDGFVRTIAGGPASRPLGGDGGPALAAGVHAIAVAAGPDGSVYVSDGSSQIRRITPAGIINRFAGADGGTEVLDGTPATSGMLFSPWGMSVGIDGSVLVTTSNRRIRAIGNDGTITTFAGNGQRLNTPPPNGVLARTEAVGFSYDVKIGPNGSVIIPDVDKNLVHETDALLPGFGSTMIAIPSLDGAVAYAFEGGRHSRTIDTSTGVDLYTLEHDAAGRLLAVIDLDGNRTSIERNPAGEATAIVAPGGQRTTLTISHGTLTTIANPAGEAHQFTYDSDGLMTSRRDPRGSLYQFRYDENGLLLRDEDPAGGYLSLVRTDSTGSADASESLSVVRTSAEGRTHRYDLTLHSNLTEESATVDSAGLFTHSFANDTGRTTILPGGVVVELLASADPRFGAAAPLVSSKTTLPSGLTRSSSHMRSVILGSRSNALSLLTSTDTYLVNGRSFTTSYDAASRTAISTSSAGRVSQTILDVKGRPVSSQLSGLAATTFTYRPDGLPASISMGSRTISFGFNERKDLTSITDALARTTRFEYDAAGRVTKQTFHDGRSVSFIYDQNGNLTSLTPPARQPHTFGFTPVNLTSTYAPPTSQPTRYVYNKDRQLTLITRADQQTVAMGYDSAGRLSTMTAPDGVYGYSYSAAGDLSSITTPANGGMTFSYDGPLLTRTSWSGEVSGSISYEYDNDFRMVGENGTSYYYDNDDLLIAAGSLTLTRDPQNGLLTGTALGAVNDSYVYNQFGEVTRYVVKAGAMELMTIEYERDGAGRIAKRTESISGATEPATTFEYDSAGRLIRVRKGAVAVAEYDYDQNGNRTTHRYLGGNATASYDAEDRLLTYDDTSFTYSADGELQTMVVLGQTTSFDYDVFGSLREVRMPGRKIDYVTDGQNRRVGKKINGTLVQGWLYADRLRIVAELDGAGAVRSRFVYGSRPNVPDFILRDGVTYRIVSDHLGSPRLVVNTANGTIAQRLDFDEFGRVLFDSNPAFQPFGFAGGLYDRDTGLLRFGARDYDPHTGRWTTADPILFDGGDANLYEYVSDDPVNLIDPTGLDAITSDPNVRQYFYDLWRLSGYGTSTKERAGWILRDPTSGNYGCKKWPWSAKDRHETWNGPIPSNMVGLAHTHPDKLSPKPSTGGTKREPKDDSAAVQIQSPVYTISRKGIWKIDPSGTITQEEGPGWVDGINGKTCATCSP